MAYRNFDELMGGTCDDPVSWAAIVGRHSITQLEFDERVKNYFGNDPQPLVSKSAETMLAIGVNCQVKSWHYNTLATNNSDINLILRDIRSSDQFSLQLFRGVNHWLGAVSFSFTLGLDNNGKKDVSFTGLNGLGQVVYYGNLGGLFP